MASGKNHDRAILVMTPIWLLTAAHYGGLWMGVLVGAAHFLGGWFLSPDLDITGFRFKIRSLEAMEATAIYLDSLPKANSSS